VALMVCGVALYATNSGYQITWFSLAFVVLGVTFTLVGNKTWQKNSHKTSADTDPIAPASSAN